MVAAAALGACAFAQPAAKFQAHDVATGLRGGYQVVIADLNHDGKPDLIALASGLTELAWYENPGWQKHVIVDGIKQPINLAVVKNDSSGVTIALATDFSPNAKNSVGTISILESGPDVTQPFKRTDIDKLPTSHRLRMMNGMLIDAPLTDESAAAPDYHGKTPLVFYKPGEWKRQLITDADDGVLHCIYPFDWDGDGKPQLLTASFQGIFLVRQMKDGKWERTKLAAGSPDPWPKSGASDVAVGKLGKERFLATIEPWHGNTVAVYTMQNREWTRAVVDTTLVDGHVLLTGNFDGNDKDAIIAGYRGRGASVNLYRNDGKQWVKSVLDEGGMAGAGCAVGDINGDGRADIACIGTSTANLKWYENLGTK
jgi:FG-GAP-like repeat